MKRRTFIAGLGAAAGWPILCGRGADAQNFRAHTVGVILQGDPWYEVVDGLREGLSRLGWLEGKEFIFDIRDTHGDLQAVTEAAVALERAKVHLIYSVSTSVTIATKQATRTTPIVFVAGTDPVIVNLVESLAKPAGRLTGVYVRATDLTGKRLELLREIVPSLRRVVIFYDPNNRSAVEAAKQARQATGILGLELIEKHVASVEALHNLLNSFNGQEADAYFGVSDAMIDIEAQPIIEWAKANKLPTMFYQQDVIAKGGLATYTTDFREGGRLSAKHVQRVLTGSNPADLPVEGLDRLLLMINLTTAKQIGLAIPESLLARADKVIE